MMDLCGTLYCYSGSRVPHPLVRVMIADSDSCGPKSVLLLIRSMYLTHVCDRCVSERIADHGEVDTCRVKLPVVPMTAACSH
jgi:hypothetical protein